MYGLIGLRFTTNTLSSLINKQLTSKRLFRGYFFDFANNFSNISLRCCFFYIKFDIPIHSSIIHWLILFNQYHLAS